MKPWYCSLLVIAILWVIAFSRSALAAEFTKTLSQELDCPGDTVGCKAEKCHFQNQIDITTNDTEITAITVKWRKSATSQCCLPNRQNGGGAIFLTYSDGSTAEIKQAEETRFPKGIKWINPDGKEFGKDDHEPAAALNNPAGFTFDKTRAGTGLKIIRIDYHMDLQCTCKATKTKNSKPWKTLTRFKVGDKEITAKTLE